LIVFPLTATRPASAVSSPAMIRSRVDFPHPDGPRREKNSPLAISKDTSDKTGVPEKAFDTALSESELIR